MSRVGKQPIAIPDGVSVEKIEGGVSVKGPKGKLTASLPAAIEMSIEAGRVDFRRPDEKKDTRARHGWRAHWWRTWCGASSNPS